MRKLTVLLKGPALVNAGYGVHCRQIFKALVENPMFDVSVENINWGHCSFLTDDSAQTKSIKQHIEKRMLEKHKGVEKYDMFIHVTIPNEFEKLGTINIGVTAGIETDHVSHVWVQKCQEMDLIIVPSEHSKNTLCSTQVQWENPQTQQRGVFKLERPVIVCAEGVDTSVFHKLAEDQLEPTISSMLSDAPDFNLLTVAQWGPGGYGQDRKNIALLIKYFIETFADRKDVGLVLKLNMARNSIMDYEHILHRLNEIKSNFKPECVPPIHLIHGGLTDKEMASLYNHPKVKAFISLTHGEGFGLPLIEAAACDLPILATNWSGHLDFLNKGKFCAIEYDLKEIPDAVVWNDVLIKGSRWAEVREEDVKRRMRKIVSAYSLPQQWATELGAKVREEYDVPVVCQHFVDVIKMGLKKDEVAPKLDPVDTLKSYIDTPDAYNVIYTMPMSAGDVFISTAVIDGLVKDLPADAKIYFATDPKFADILKDNKHIHKVIPYNQNMLQLDLLEEVFDVAFTPNINTQYMFSNWIHRGQGRLLAEEFANHCNSQLGEYFIKREPFENAGFSLPYMTIHTGPGVGTWEARKYLEWQELVNNLKNVYPELDIVQVGDASEPLLKDCTDLRGKTSVHQLADVIANSKLHLSIDTFTMHLAAGFGTPVVALFGSSHAASTGPWVKDRKTAKIILLEAEHKLGCSKACYKYECKKNKQMPCINEIDPKQVLTACCGILGKNYGTKIESMDGFEYQRIFGKISGYTTVYNCEKLGIPYIPAIKSMLGFCDEVVVVDGCSDDGTYEKLQELVAQDARVKVYQNPFDWTEPGVDGLQKAFARAVCENEFLWQQDADEIVHEDDYNKIKLITKRFPTSHDILHLPVIELWGSSTEVTARRHCWKWRMSKNNPQITHGINAAARLTDEKTGKIYAKEGMSDGCEYVDLVTNQMMPHTGFYNDQIDAARKFMPDHYSVGINEVFDKLPSVWHTSWMDIDNKINQLKKGGTWDKLWSLLYQKESMERFPGVETAEQVKELSKKLLDQGGEDNDEVKYKFAITKQPPKLLTEWIDSRKK
jgi:ADP-heptose:LPS heptosyltransferase/glycosyltransferase involved in cell wall biosynthesis